MPVSKKQWGALPDGRAVHLFTLDGGAGVVARISDFGGIVASLQTPDRNGRTGEIGLGFETLEGYLAKPNYYGALIGRVANRIRGGKFVLDGKTYHLYTDVQGIHLHGGKEGFNVKLWDAAIDGDRLRLDYVSPDGEENYPGRLAATVWYEVRGTDLRIEYEATTDAPTIVNLTNHEFFNLNGCAGDVLSHELRIQAQAYTPVDGTLLPTGEIAPVAGTPMDFTEAKAIGRDLKDIPEGYDHNYVLSRTTDDAGEWLVDAYDPSTGRTLAMATTEPCVQLYIGNFLDGSDVGIGGKAYKKRYAFCLEAQKHPDGINHANFASPVLRPGETYSQTTVYRFGAR
ncbi:MAG: galactose mutarotase [Planctomycetota bacterium]|jgi:aldose 1-epimerase|nr:galactose mutarotase [Planctomycetota bacterium]